MKKRLDRATQRVPEEAPSEVSKRQFAEEWLAENQQAIAAYNEHVEAHDGWSTPAFLVPPLEPG